jgi:hypothetical protein
MAENTSLVRHDVIGGGIEFSIWGNTAKLSNFFTAIEEATGGSPVDRLVTVKAHTRKRYPGDSGYGVQEHPRRYTPEIGQKGRITPGRNFYCELEFENPVSGKPDWDVFQFTHTGPVMALRAYAKANAATDFRLRSESGRYIDVGPTP